MELVAENRRLVEDVVKKGRSVGICTILATQKSTGDAIPTAIRDVCPVALSFAQRTDEAAVAALGEDIRRYPEANPVSLQDPAYLGVASMVQGRPGLSGCELRTSGTRKWLELSGGREPQTRPGHAPARDTALGTRFV